MTELENEVLKLDPPARARLAEVLLRSLDELSESEVEALWLYEAERPWSGRGMPARSKGFRPSR